MRYADNVDTCKRTLDTKNFHMRMYQTVLARYRNEKDNSFREIRLFRKRLENLMKLSTGPIDDRVPSPFPVGVKLVGSFVCRLALRGST